MSIFDENPYPGDQMTTPGTGPGPFGAPTTGYTGGLGGSLSGLAGPGQPPRPIQAAGAPAPGGGMTPDYTAYDPTKPVTPYQQPAPGAPAPSGGGTGTAPTVNRNDPASVDAYLAYWAQQPGVNPSVGRDPAYWKQKIMSGELGDDPGYYVSKFRTPEGPPAGAGGGGGYGNYDLTGSVGPGAGGTGFTQPFQGLSLEQLRNTPGYQFELGEGLKGVQGAAAAGGRLYTGGTLKSLANYATGLADRTYGDAYGRARNEYLDAYNIDRNNRSDIYGRYYNLSSFGTQNPGA